MKEYKIGDIIEINIDDTITNCVIIDMFDSKSKPINEGDHLVNYSNSQVYHQLPASMESLKIHSNQISIILYPEYANNYINKYSSRAYSLLIGDQKVWLILRKH